MMIKNIIYASAVVLLMTVAGCNKYLDILPDDKPVLEDAFKDRYNAEKYLFTCYGSMPAVANPTNTLGLSGGGDVVYDPLNAPGGNTAHITNTTLMFFNGNNAAQPHMNFWDGENGATANIWQGIRHCNVFLEHIGLEDGGPRDMDEMERERWIAEVKTIKAYLNFYLFQLYGPIPIVDKVIPIAAKGEELALYREPVDRVADYIVGLLDEAIETLPASAELDAATEFGRFTKTIARCIKAKTLVLAASPLFNNNNYYAGFKDKRGVDLFPAGDSRQRWQRALEAADEAVRSAEEEGYSIFISTDAGSGAIPDVNSTNINDTTKAMISLRQAVTEPWNPEIIWGTNENTRQLQRFASMLSNSEWENIAGSGAPDIGQRHSPTLNMVESFYSSNGVPIEEDAEWEANGWYTNRYTTKLPEADHTKFLIRSGQETALLHHNRSLRFYASVGFDGGIWEGRSQQLSNPAFPNFIRHMGSGFKYGVEYGFYPLSGYLAKKLVHLKTTYTATRVELIYEPYTFPIIRLADMYLLLAECLNEVDGPNTTDSQGNNAYHYLDAIRARSGMEGVVESWQKYASGPYKSKPDNQNGLRQIIRQERINELAFEGHYYYDVRRWLMAEEVYNQPILGWNKEGENKADFYVLKVLVQPRFSMRDYLMPIKTNTLLQNRNLIQNPGW
ncbi:putative outer membrane starch-binding protein [Sphingobacterium allocomposti]|uniref:Putative outer membrane starch-binding protein n=1 Tax=Sphingobacterium allocomposti TaxID=415956 RepID=A0A5S5D098_9SPHI|nr:RagB/SusD family nutrient uptake outer membrane protein [Sphingobacterium composti Yoo et al. 2007 non Ten et al. 2007]TYP88212.1 putative outer membrane starch-binding protein [Sphingobacterium composti Yoo et al. 2007 non Ten et al. 2007]